MTEQNRKVNRKRFNERAMLSSRSRGLNGLTVTLGQEQRSACLALKVFYKPGLALPLLNSSDRKQDVKKWPPFSKTLPSLAKAAKSFKETNTEMPPNRTFTRIFQNISRMLGGEISQHPHPRTLRGLSGRFLVYPHHPPPLLPDL